MGQIYRTPEGIEPPGFEHPFDHEKYSKQVEEYVEKTCQWAKKNGNGKYAGKILSFQVADGYARYVVVSLRPVVLIHIADGDGYDFQYANRLTAADIKKEIDRQEAFQKIFREHARHDQS